MLLVLLLWLSLLNPHGADRFVDNLAGSQQEYKIVLGAAMLATALASWPRFMLPNGGTSEWLWRREPWHFSFTVSRPSAHSRENN